MSLAFATVQHAGVAQATVGDGIENLAARFGRLEVLIGHWRRGGMQSIDDEVPTHGAWRN